MEKPSTEDSRKTDAKTTARRPRSSPWMFLLLGAALLLLYMFTQLPRYSHIEDYGYFLQLIRDGLSNREIGERLFVSERTAQTHVQHILDKLDVGTRAEAAADAVERGLI